MALIAGSEHALAPLRSVRATFAVGSLAEFEADLRASGGTILQPPSPTPAGRNMIVRDVEGVAFEFVEARSAETQRREAMRAAVLTGYGDVDKLEIREVPEPGQSYCTRLLP